MRRAPIRGWWALPITAGLTLIVPAPAQSPGPAGAPGQPPPGFRAARGPAGEDPNRLAEIHVGLGWLADPMTFPYRLAARARAGTLEIRGFVPNEAVRARAVKVAREHCEFNVVDNLKIQPVNVPTATVPPAELHKAVQAALKATFPRQAASISVLCRPYGQVILTGRVTSLEERLAVSQELRHLSGCSSVVNRLAVVGPRPPAQPPQAASPSQKGPGSNFAVSTQPLTFTRVAPAARVDSGMNAAQGPALPAPGTASPSGPSASPAGAGQPGRMPVPEGPKFPVASPYAAAQGQPQSPASQMPLPKPAPTPPSGSPYAASASPGQPRPQTVASASPPGVTGAPSSPYASWSTPAQAKPQTFAAAPSLPTPEKPAAPAGPSPQCTRAPVTPPGGLALASPPVQTPAGVWTPAPANQVVQTSFRPEGVTPAPVPPPTPAAPPLPGPAVSKSAWAPVNGARLSLSPPGEPYVTRGFVLLDDVGPQTAQPQPAAPAIRPQPVAPVARPQPVAPAIRPQPVVPAVRPQPVAPAIQSQPVAPAVRPQPVVPPGDPWVRLQEHLKQAVRTACGPSVTDVEVEIWSSTEAQVRFRAPSKAEADRIWGQIQRLPELAPYKKLDVIIKAPDTGR
jgi:hypothetical protein